MSASFDSVEPGSESTADTSPGFFESLFKSLLPGKGQPTRSSYREAYDSGPSFTDMLPWVEYLSDSHQFIFEDGVTRMAVFEIDPIPTEGRSQKSLGDASNALALALADTFPELDRDPWVFQMYASSEPDVFHHLERLKSYISSRAAGSEFTELFLAKYEQHLQDVSRTEGYFYDDVVTDSIWRGQSKKIRLVVYRRYWNSRPVEPPEAELEQVISKLLTGIDALGVTIKQVDGEGFYEWMLHWFNPRPAICGGDPTRLLEVAPYPGDENLPVGRDFAQMVTLSPPRINQNEKLWYFDDMPHTIIQLLGLNGPPKKGQLTGELLNSGKVFSIADRLPEGSTIAMTVTITPQDTVANGISLIEDRAVGDIAESKMARQEARLVLERMAHGDKLFPCEVAIYLREETPLELRKAVNRTRGLLGQHMMSTVDPNKDAIQISNFKRNLPGVYIPELDRNSAKRARFMFVRDQASIAPVYGRSRGTNNPGILFFNRSAEPLSFDPLNPADRQKNAHMLIYGPTGAGKSATLNYLMASMMAVHRPRLFIIEAGNSFGLLGEYFERHGVSTNGFSLSMKSILSIPPFGELTKLVKNGRDTAGVAIFEDDDSTLERDLADFDSDDTDELERDYLGEAEIIAKLMITGGEDEEVKRMMRSHRMVIRKALVLAAENVVGGKTNHKTVLPEDVADALMELARSDEYKESMKEIREMSDSMRMFCDGLNGHLFNREGDLWPEADVTIVDLAEAAGTGKEDTLAVAYVSLIQHVNGLVERDQNASRPTIVLTDEGHVITTNPLLAPYVIKITKMWRKLGCWFWIATQNVEDFPDSARRMLNMMEYWLALTMPKDEIEQTSRFKQLTPEQEHMMGQCVKVPGKFVEGVVLGDKLKTLFRVVPPAIMLALSLTEKHEKAEREDIVVDMLKERRRALRAEGLTDEEVEARLAAMPKLTHVDAAEVVAERIRTARMSAMDEHITH